MQYRHINRENYFKEQAYTTNKYYIPYLEKHMGHIPKTILEVGCGEGGNLLPFAERHCEVFGVDIATFRIEEAKSFFKEEKQKGTFIASDIFKLKEFYNLFDLIIVHDVIEHIGDKVNFLLELHKFLSPKGYLFISFPAWQMPFGGHQQTARKKITSHLPFIHLLPTHLYKFTLKILGEKENTIKQLLEIKKDGCTIEYFLKIVNRTHYKIIHQQLYLINPHYEIKFGLTPQKLNNKISSIPFLRNFFSTSCFYLLKSKNILY